MMIEFLLARIAEDEAHARKDLGMAAKATPGRWQAWIGHNLPLSQLRARNGDEHLADFGGPDKDANATLAGRFNPAVVTRRANRAIAEAASKRYILGELEEPRDGCRCPSCQVVRHMTTVYDGHPDHQAEWRP